MNIICQDSLAKVGETVIFFRGQWAAKFLRRLTNRLPEGDSETGGAQTEQKPSQGPTEPPLSVYRMKRAEKQGLGRPFNLVDYISSKN